MVEIHKVNNNKWCKKLNRVWLRAKGKITSMKMDNQGKVGMQSIQITQSNTAGFVSVTDVLLCYAFIVSKVSECEWKKRCHYKWEKLKNGNGHQPGRWELFMTKFELLSLRLICFVQICAISNTLSKKIFSPSI